MASVPKTLNEAIYTLWHPGMSLKARLKTMEIMETTLRGWKDGHYIIVDPFINRIGTELELNIGNEIEIRMICSGFVAEFQTKILKIMDGFNKIVFLKFPDHIIKKNLRNDLRIETTISALLEFNEKKYDATIIDISNGGCRINAPDTPLKIFNACTLNFLLPDGKNIVGLNCIVRNQAKDSTFGIMFQENDPELINLQSFIEFCATMPGLKKLVEWSSNELVAGTLKQIALTDLLQVLNAGRKTAQITIRNKGSLGNIFLDKGKVINSSFDVLKGEESFFALIGLEEADFVLKSPSKIPPQNIFKTIEALIIQGAVLKDTKNYKAG